MAALSVHIAIVGTCDLQAELLAQLGHPRSQGRVRRDASGEGHARHLVALQRVTQLTKKLLAQCCLKRRRHVGQGYLAMGLGGAHDGRLEPREREVKVVADHRDRQFHRDRRALLGQSIDLGPARIAQAEPARHFVVSLARRVVNRLAEHDVLSGRRCSTIRL